MYTKHQWLIALYTSLLTCCWRSIVSSHAESTNGKAGNSRFHFASAQGGASMHQVQNWLMAVVQICG